MADLIDMIMPMLREMPAEMKGRFDGVDRRVDTVDRRLEKLEAGYKSMHHAMTGDTLMSKLVAGEFEQRIEAPKQKMERLEKRS